ncbi:MAG TPA: copper chaperone [Ferruginibacter sp.]|nr:copper chaperone [Ferruginibacter sp.]HRE62523.1 copper chaperone [Ferruginibacter sp.]
MKVLSILAVLCLGIFTKSSAQELESQIIKVWGNCGMCKETIEKSAIKAGAATANWSEETKMLQVSFNDKKTSSQKIQKRIAKSGYDTQDFVATDKAYNALHGCCKYDRKADAKKADATLQKK